MADSTKEALIFVHGYNSTFSDSVRRTAQLTYDLAFSGPALTYSWPSEGRIASYVRDESNAEWAVPHARQVLMSLRSAGINRVNIIAHSMGNLVAVNGLAGIPPELRPRARAFILAAPDIGRDYFLTLATAVRSAAESVTLYASARDQALRVSKGLHGYPRAGDAEDILIVDGVTSIDASHVSTDFLGHGYFSEERSL